LVDFHGRVLSSYRRDHTYTPAEEVLYQDIESMMIHIYFVILILDDQSCEGGFELRAVATFKSKGPISTLPTIDNNAF
jgi:hypothetical protein